VRSVRDLCETAVEAALAEGASYADARAVVPPPAGEAATVAFAISEEVTV